jgi:hypothetical protein
MENLQNSPTVNSILNNLTLDGEILTFQADTRTRIKSFYNPSVKSNNDRSIVNNIKSFEITFQARRKNYVVNIYNDRVIIILDDRYMLNINKDQPESLDKATGSTDTIFNINISSEIDNTIYNIDDIIEVKFNQVKLLSVLVLGNLYVKILNHVNSVVHNLQIFPKDIELNTFGKPNVNTYSFNIGRVLYDEYDEPEEDQGFILEEHFPKDHNSFITLFIIFVNGRAALNTDLYEEFDEGMSEKYEPDINDRYDTNTKLGKHNKHDSEFSFDKRQRN